MKRTAKIGLTCLVVLSLLGASVGWLAAQGAPEVPLAMEKDKFVPAELRVKAGRPFVLVVTNKDDVSHELDISKLKIERKSGPGRR